MSLKNEKLELWKEKRREFEKSGLTRKAFCQKNRIKESTLDYWFSRIRKLQKGQGLVEVKHDSIPNTNRSLLAVVIGKYRIEISNFVEPRFLIDVIKALECQQ
jgi:hypothetical protein